MIFFDVFRNRVHSPHESARSEQLRWFDFAPRLSIISFCLLCLRKCVVDSQAVTYCKLSVK